MDVREEILGRLILVATAVTGIVSVERNRLDVPGLRRPAIILHDGAEELIDVPPKERQSRIARMTLAPALTIFARIDEVTPAGPLLSGYRSKLVQGVLSDQTLLGLVGTNGAINYHGCLVQPPMPDSREPRMDVTFHFNYVLRLSDL
jgi:hypothetical protein